MFVKIKKWLEEMGKRNEKLYGRQRLDCCGLNRPDSARIHPEHPETKKHRA